MLDGSGQNQRELEHMLSINEGYLVSFLLLQAGTPLRGFSKVRTITTTINTKIPHSVPTGKLELNIFIGHSLTDFKSLQRSYWEERSSVPLWLQEPSDLPELSQCQHYLITRFFWDLEHDSILLHQHTLQLPSFQTSNMVQSTALRNLPTSWIKFGEKVSQYIWYDLPSSISTPLKHSAMWEENTILVIFFPLKEALNFRSIMSKLNLNNKSRKPISNFQDLYYRTDLTQ